MGVVRDVTVEQLTQAIGGIDTSGLAKDTTLQATNTALGNINTTLGGITTNDPPTDTTQQSIASAISGLGQTLGSDRALIDGSNIVDKATFRQNIGLDNIFADLNAFDELTIVSPLPTTEASYTLNHSFTDYSIIVLQYCNYNNVLSSVTISSAYLDATTTGSRVLMPCWSSGGTYHGVVGVRKNADNSLYIETNITAANSRLRVYGVQKIV